MKKICMPLLIFLVSGIAAPALFAQEKEPLIITADKAVEIALENNLLLKTSEVEYNAAVRARRNRWNEFLPSLMASAGIKYSDQLFTDIESQSTGMPALDALFSSEPWNMTIGAQASLNLNLSMMENIKKITRDYEAGKLSYEKAMMEVERDILKSYYGLISFKASIDLLVKNLDMAEKRYEQAEANYRNGLLPEVEVLRAQVMVANLKPTYTKTLSQYENTLLLFKFQLGLDLDQPIEIQGDLDVVYYKWNAEELVDAYLMKRLDIQILEKSIASTKAQKMGALYGLMTPSLALSGNWGTQVGDFTNSDQWAEGTFRDNFAFSITLAVPLDALIPGSKGSQTVKSVQDGIDMMNLQKEMVVKQAKIQIVNVVQSLNTSKETIDAYTLAVKLARKSYELTEEAYQLGTKEQLDVQTAQNEMFKAEADVIGEKVQYISALLDLEFALSTPIEDVVKE